MIYLIIVSLIWSFSFGLIKGQLSAIDPHFVAFIRLLLSFLFFLPFLRFSLLKNKNSLLLVITGVVQFGLMYIIYIYSYKFLQAWQVALFTIFTPMFVVLFDDLFSKKFNFKNFALAVWAIIGAFIVTYDTEAIYSIGLGFILIQISNLCFAFGQVYYRRKRNLFYEHSDLQIFALLYFGAVFVSGLNSLVNTNWLLINIEENQIYTLLYLGIIASGISFFLWNLGATKVNAAVLAVMNNLKIPLGISSDRYFY